jgi:hypothetical protein
MVSKLEAGWMDGGDVGDGMFANASVCVYLNCLFFSLFFFL